MQFSFTGRESELQHVDNLIKAKQGTLYAISGRSGIGKSSLLRQLASIHNKKGQAFVDLNNVPPIQTAVEFLQYLAKQSLGLTQTKKTLAKIDGTYKSAADLLEPYKPLLQSSIKLAVDENDDDFNEAEKNKLNALANTMMQLGGMLWKKWQEYNKAKLGDPELLLLKALQQDCKKQPLIFIDTYERLQAAQELNRQKISSFYSQPHQGLKQVNDSLSLQDWLDRLLEFLQQSGAIIVVAGRKTGHWRGQDLQHFNDEDIANIVGSSDYADLQELLTEPESYKALLSVLKRLSFDGIPLWLQLALNFVSLELENGGDLMALAANSDIHKLFATPELNSDLSSANIDHANCKLALFKRVMQHNLDLASEAWKMALPRRINQQVLTLVFAEQADAIRETFIKSGLLPSVRWSPKTNVALHEEIRDLLLAYSSYQGWLETDTTKAIHKQLAEHFQRNYQATGEINDMLERIYHSLMSENTTDLESIQDANLLADMALKLQDEKQYGKMAQVMLRLIAIQADYLSPWCGLGIALSELGQLDDAAAAYRRQLDVKPDHDYAGYNLGNILYQSGQLDVAVTAYRRQLDAKPDHEYAWNNLGIALFDLGRLDDAMAAFRCQLDVKPDHKSAGYNLGNVLAQLGQLGGAVDAYQQQLDVKPDHENAWNNLGNALFQLGQWDDAMAAFQQQLEIKHDHENARYNLGNALFQLGQWDDAVTTLQQQLEVKPDHENAWSALGDALYQLGRLNDAVFTYRQQLNVKPDHEHAWNNLGNALYQLAQLDDAVAAFQQQLDVKPNHENAWNNLGVTYLKQSNLEQAQQSFANALDINPKKLSALSNDAELALVQNDKNRCLQRIDNASTLVDNKTQEYAVLKFLAWLAEPENSPDAVYQALEQLDKNVKINWNFTDTEPVILRLTAEQQTVARQLIADLQHFPGALA